ncbi:MAG TPA: hypothetical protein PK453_18000 [Leptospiraceae bacterium]|nr:hypothetical protein [Leptospiraceae bacterium]HMY65695.1 hypothetical protein [Leptospiraceae bacterium]HNF15563.1 hypothetical protein [Leptospiraceae bacterium]HNH07751.1 hypothetical protein [Leptospiraceae bacterium]HNI25104.1 hypothetical protein [Leptospiraceae bacterium]
MTEKIYGSKEHSYNSLNRLILLLSFFISGCSASSSSESANVNSGSAPFDYKSKFSSQIFQVGPADRNRFFDCVEKEPVTYPIPFWVINTEFNYFGKALPGLQYGLIEKDKWPILVGMYGPPESVKKPKAVIVMRGDTSGYHKSAAAKPYVYYMQKYGKNEVMFFLDEFYYLNKNSRNLESSPIMSLCHNRYYWFGYVGRAWPPLEKGGNWEILDKFFPEDQEYDIFSYSNATWPRMEFILRENAPGYTPVFKKIKDPKAFLADYIQNTRQKSPRTNKIMKMLDIDGNYHSGKPMWDLLAYLRETVDKDPNKYYHSVVRIDKEDAYPIQVKMVQALDLQGEEDATGIVRFSNERKNIIIDFMTTPWAPHYINMGIDLRRATVFKQRDPSSIRRKWLNHYNMIRNAVDIYAAGGK